MKGLLLREMRSQSGFTLVELLVASAISVIVMTGLTSVLFTTWRAGTIATGRIEASSQIRNFQFEGYDDFALANMPLTSGCGGSAANPCTTQPIVLGGFRASNSANPTTSPYHVTYTWDGSNLLYRQIGTNPPPPPPCQGACREAATSVTSFAWYVDRPPSNPGCVVTSPPLPMCTVVVAISVTVQSYTETQTLRFYPRVNP